MILRKGEYPGSPLSSSYSPKLTVLQDILRLLTPKSWWFPMTPLSDEHVQRLVSEAATGELEGVKIACAHMHDNHCLVEDILGACRWTTRVWHMYALVHLVPHLLFKKDRFSARALKQLLKNYCQTLGFFWLYALTTKFYICFGKEVPGGLNTKRALLILAFIPIPVFTESRKRWSQFAMAVFPRWLEALPPFLSKMRLWPSVPYGEQLVFAWTFAVLSTGYFTQREGLNKSVEMCLRLVLGDRFEEGDEVEKDCSEKNS